MKSSTIAIIALLGACVAAPSFAQPGLGMGGMGGMGMGPGKAARFSVNKDNTTGWALMSPAERSAHQQKMWSFTNYDECKSYQAEHHKTMETKAKERGKTLPAPRNNACDRMKARGLFK